MPHTPPRILAIDPGTRHMGVAVLSGTELIYYTVKDFKRHRPADTMLRATRAILLQLIHRYQPTVLAYEKTFYVQQKASALLHVQELEIARVGRAEKLMVVGYAPAHVRKMLCQDGRATKHQVANILVRQFSELAGYRHPGAASREKYWLNMFDAIAVGVVASAAIDADGERAHVA